MQDIYCVSKNVTPSLSYTYIYQQQHSENLAGRNYRRMSQL